MLRNKVFLCYIRNEEIFDLINKNITKEKDFLQKEKKWENEIKKMGFFSDTKLMLIHQDMILLKVLNEEAISFLAKTYRFAYQEICQRVFREKKNIILISEKQWNSLDISKRSIVLWKDEEISKEFLASWLKEFNASSKI